MSPLHSRSSTRVCPSATPGGGEDAALPACGGARLGAEHPVFVADRYGFDKESEFKADEPTNVVFYDLGSTSFKVRRFRMRYLAWPHS